MKKIDFSRLKNLFGWSRGFQGWNEGLLESLRSLSYSNANRTHRGNFIYVVKEALLLFVCMGLITTPILLGQDDCNEQVKSQMQVDPGHPWRPPFGLDRIGQPFRVRVNITADHRPLREYSLVGYLKGKEVDRQLLHLQYKAPYFADTASLKIYPAEIALYAKCTFQGQPIQLLRLAVQPPVIEADAIARPDLVINPVDLGTVLFPSDWLLLAKGQRFAVQVAAIGYVRDIPDAKVSARLESSLREQQTIDISLKTGHRVDVKLAFPPVKAAVRKDTLHVRIADKNGTVLWHKEMRAILVSDPPHWPKFGATATKLRFDAPISVRDPVTGAMSTMKYEGAWRQDLKDVVVSFPNGARFVFWRGSSYVPFWASRHDTGFTYEWAETTPPPGGFNDSVEPLMDKELRYGHVEILESTPSRVHVRWTYQSCDFDYKVWGDSVAEDFYFYPDGFGTRVLHLKSAMGSNYELSELILLTPQAAYPFKVIPHTPVSLLFVDGLKREISFPFYVEGLEKPFTWPNYLLAKAKDTPVIYRIRLNKSDAETAIYFDPLDTHLPAYLFAPFHDRGVVVTPAYWGSHWPLSRGKTTGGSIDDRISVSPSHNSLMSWGRVRPKPNSTAWIEDLDTLGRSKPMSVGTWIWLIGMTSAPDARVIDRARSFMSPPSIELKGARLDFNSYVPARRAIRLVVENPEVVITLKPTVMCIDPVFELRGPRGDLVSVNLAGQRLAPSDYAWDGHTLWLNATIKQETQLRLEFNQGGTH